MALVDSEVFFVIFSGVAAAGAVGLVLASVFSSASRGSSTTTENISSIRVMVYMSPRSVSFKFSVGGRTITSNKSVFPDLAVYDRIGPPTYLMASSPLLLLLLDEEDPPPPPKVPSLPPRNSFVVALRFRLDSRNMATSVTPKRGFNIDHDPVIHRPRQNEACGRTCSITSQSGPLAKRNRLA